MKLFYKLILLPLLNKSVIVKISQYENINQSFSINWDWDAKGFTLKDKTKCGLL